MYDAQTLVDNTDRSVSAAQQTSHQFSVKSNRSSNKQYCVRHSSTQGQEMIECSTCGNWFHVSYVHPSESTFGRLINHSKKYRNCRVQAVQLNGQPQLCVFALRDIQAGEELLFDYGVRVPWPDLKVFQGQERSYLLPLLIFCDIAK